MQHGIDPFVGAKTPDFGLGFYATTWLDQAKSWANLRAMRRSGFRAVVLAFLVPRDDLAELEALVFTNEKVATGRLSAIAGKEVRRMPALEPNSALMISSTVRFPSASRSLSLKTVIKSASTR